MSSPSSRSSSSATPSSARRSSARERKPAPGRSNSVMEKTYPRGPPITTEERLFAMLNEAKFTAASLVAADDILVPLFNDTRNNLQVRRVGSRQLSRQENKLLKESFGTAFSREIDPDYPQWQAESFTARMKSHELVAMDGDKGDAFSNLALRYSRLKHSQIVRVGHAIIKEKVEARIVAQTHIPGRTVLLELGGVMSTDVIECKAVGSNHNDRSRRKGGVPSKAAYEMFSVIWKAYEQRGPGPRKDRLLLGPARFINHSCTPNSRLIPFPKTHAWGVETSRDVREGEEITVSYGDYYFAPGECACATCVTISSGGIARETPSTSLASSPAGSSNLDKQHAKDTRGSKRRLPESESGLNSPPRLAKKVRR